MVVSPTPLNQEVTPLVEPMTPEEKRALELAVLRARLTDLRNEARHNAANAKRKYYMAAMATRETAFDEVLALIDETFGKS